MHRGVGKHRVELVVKRQLVGRSNTGVEAALPGRLDHLRRGVSADHLGPSRGNTFGESALPATHVENAFAGARVEQREDLPGQVRDESRTGGIHGRVPAIGFSFRVHAYSSRGTKATARVGLPL